MKRNVIARGVWVLAAVAAVGCGVDDSDQEVAAQAIRGRCHAGAACVPNNPCQIGTISCVNRAPVCVASGNLPAGTSCGTNLVCNGSGTCGACTAGAACTPASRCHVGVISCAAGAPICVTGANSPNGASCGTDLVCNTGQCVACTPGLACASVNVCKVGVTSCTTGTAVCVDSANRPAGTACGVGRVCDGEGNCG